jgi:hypothetical protein
VSADFAAPGQSATAETASAPLVEPIFTLDASHGGEGIVDVRLRMI